MAKRNWKKVYGSRPKRRTKKQLGGMAGALEQFKTGVGDYAQQGVDAFKANPGGMIGNAAGAVGQLIAQRQLKKSGTAEDALRNDISQRKSAATSGLATGFAAGMNSGLGKALGKMGVFGKIGQGLVGAFGAVRGKNLAKTQQEKDRKEAVGQLRVKQDAELKSQKAGASSFDAGPMGRTGFGAATSGTRAEDQRMQRGGVKQLRGGNMTNLPGGAVQFTGAKHSKGGIDLDKNTEVEGGETMDKVQMRKKGGKASDYIFSEYLKLGGKSYAQRHKEILNRGGRQDEIQNLAKLQERSAEADGDKDRGENRVMETGGERRKYQTGGDEEGGVETETTEPTTRTLSLYESIQSVEDFANAVNLPEGHSALDDPKLMNDLWKKTLNAIVNKRNNGEAFDKTDNDQLQELIGEVTQESIDDMDSTARDEFESKRATALTKEKDRIEKERKAKEELGEVEKVKDDDSGERIYGGNESSDIPRFLDDMERDLGNLPEGVPKFDFNQYKTDGEWDVDKWNQEAAGKFRTYWNDKLPAEYRSGKISTSGTDIADLAHGRQWASLTVTPGEQAEVPEAEFEGSKVAFTPKVEEEIKEDDKKEEITGGTPAPRKPGDVPLGAYMGGLAQLIPPMYAFRNPPATVQAPGAESIQAGRLHRVNHNAERAANAGDFRATQAMIENNTAGPGGMVNMIAAMGKKQQGDLAIANAESNINKELASEEAKMQQQASTSNATLGLQAGQYATHVAREQIKDRREEKLGALDAAAERIAGITGDVLDYRAQERMAQAIGRDGVYCRERLMAGGMSEEEATQACGGAGSGGSGDGNGGSGGGGSNKSLQESTDAKLLTMVDEDGNEYKPSGEELTEAEKEFRDKKIQKHSEKMDNPKFGLSKEDRKRERQAKKDRKNEAKEGKRRRKGRDALFTEAQDEEWRAGRTDEEIQADIKKARDEAKRLDAELGPVEQKRGGYFRGRRKIIRKKRTRKSKR